MPLTAGTRLGVYEITSVMGAGGMGEVYRARDTKLDRDVAIKVLPELFADDPDRLARFEREAKTLAALNHPLVAQVYGVIDKPPALVMELVDGEDLAQRLARGAVSVDDAVGIAMQIAEALEAAHEQGIVHRDLKPANVRIRPDGTVKVLDFGLAKALHATPSDSGSPAGAMNSPTFMSPAMTELGMILGTAAYMAPEQARGRTVDRRADIWAFGCVLYEMLTGRNPFGGEDISLTLAAILKEDVDFARLPRETPPQVRRVLRRCLEKDPRQRLGWIGDARLDLAEPAVKTDDVARPAKPRRRMLVFAAGVLVAGAAGVWLGSMLLLPTAHGGPDFTLRRLTELPGPEMAPDISPDGRQVVFSSRASGQADVYLLRVGGARAMNLTAASAVDDHQPAFSPDGEQIAFRSERDGGGLFVMGATGESVRRLTSTGFNPAWSPDGRSIAFSTEGITEPYSRYSLAQLHVVDVATGQVRFLAGPDGVQPAWSPDGGRVAYWANSGGQRDIWIVSAQGGSPRQVTDDTATDWAPEWSPDGRWLYFCSDRGGQMNLWRIPLDVSGMPSGAPEAVTRSLTGIGYARLNADGSRVSLFAYTRSSNIMMASFDPAGAGRVTLSGVVHSPTLAWCAPSPTGNWLACATQGAQEDIVLMRANGSETVRLTDDRPKDRNISWSPDGERLAFMSTRSGKWDLWSLRRDGSDLRRMTDLGSDVYEAVWSPDGTKAMSASTADRMVGTWIFDPGVLTKRDSAKFVRHDTPQPFSVEVWSPDGKLAAGAMLGSDGYPQAPAVWDLVSNSVRRFDVPVAAGQNFRTIAGWLADSKRLVSVTPAGLALIDVATGRWTGIAAPTGGSRYRLTAGATKLMIEHEVLDADVWLLEMKR